VKMYIDFLIAIGHGRPRTIILFTTQLHEIMCTDMNLLEKDSIISLQLYTIQLELGDLFQINVEFEAVIL